MHVHQAIREGPTALRVWVLLFQILVGDIMALQDRHYFLSIGYDGFA